MAFESGEFTLFLKACERETTVVPDGDISADSGWQNQSGGTTNLYQSIDDNFDTPNDLDYIEQPSLIGSTKVRFSLQNTENRVDFATCNVRALRPNFNVDLNVKIFESGSNDILMSGGDTVTSTSFSNIAIDLVESSGFIFNNGYQFKNPELELEVIFNQDFDSSVKISAVNLETCGTGFKCNDVPLFIENNTAATVCRILVPSGDASTEGTHTTHWRTENNLVTPLWASIDEGVEFPNDFDFIKQISGAGQTSVGLNLEELNIEPQSLMFKIRCKNRAITSDNTITVLLFDSDSFDNNFLCSL